MFGTRPHLSDSKTHVPSAPYREVTGAKSGSYLRNLSKCSSAFICSCLPAFAHSVSSAFHQPSSHLPGRGHLSLLRKASLASPSQNSSLSPSLQWVCQITPVRSICLGLAGGTVAGSRGCRSMRPGRPDPACHQLEKALGGDKVQGA